MKRKRHIHYWNASTQIQVHHTATREIWQQQKRSGKIKIEDHDEQSSTGPNMGRWMRKLIRKLDQQS